MNYLSKIEVGALLYPPAGEFVKKRKKKGTGKIPGPLLSPDLFGREPSLWSGGITLPGKGDLWPSAFRVILLDTYRSAERKKKSIGGGKIEKKTLHLSNKEKPFKRRLAPLLHPLLATFLTQKKTRPKGGRCGEERFGDLYPLLSSLSCPRVCPSLRLNFPALSFT